MFKTTQTHGTNPVPYLLFCMFRDGWQLYHNRCCQKSTQRNHLLPGRKAFTSQAWFSISEDSSPSRFLNLTALLALVSASEASRCCANSALYAVGVQLAPFSTTLIWASAWNTTTSAPPYFPCVSLWNSQLHLMWTRKTNSFEDDCDASKLAQRAK